MAGDSITESAAAHRPPAVPPLDGPAEPLGYGYVTIVHSLLRTTCPHLGIRVVNAGRGGDITPALAARWQRDVLDLRPDWVSLMIGINDSDPWRQPVNKHNLVSLDVFRATLDEIVARTLPAVRGMVLLTPFYLMTDRSHPYRSSVDEYVAAVKSVAAAGLPAGGHPGGDGRSAPAHALRGALARSRASQPAWPLRRGPRVLPGD